MQTWFLSPITCLIDQIILGTGRQVDRLIGRQTGGQAGKQAGRQAGRQAGGQVGRRCLGGWVCFGWLGR